MKFIIVAYIPEIDDIAYFARVHENGLPIFIEAAGAVKQMDKEEAQLIYENIKPKREGIIVSMLNWVEFAEAYQTTRISVSWIKEHNKGIRK